MASLCLGVTSLGPDQGGARFTGQPGLANGSLKLAQKAILTLGRVHDGHVANVLRWDVPKANARVAFGCQVLSLHGLINQTTDAIYASVNGRGVIKLNATVGGQKIRAEQAKINLRESGPYGHKQPKSEESDVMGPR